MNKKSEIDWAAITFFLIIIGLLVSLFWTAHNYTELKELEEKKCIQYIQAKHYSDYFDPELEYYCFQLSESSTTTIVPMVIR